MYSAVDIEGHIGSDGRFYILDFSRTFPPEAPKEESEKKFAHLFRLLRYLFFFLFFKNLIYSPMILEGNW